MEKWLPIKNHETYLISDSGKVKNKFGVILKPQPTNKQYLRVDLYKNGKCKHFKIHRLVAEAFIPNPNNLPQVNHKDCNKQNNSADNLEWTNNQLNMRHAYDNNLSYNYRVNGKFAKRPI